MTRPGAATGPRLAAEQERLCRLFEIVWCGLPRTSAGAAGVGGFKTAMRRLGIIDSNAMARPQRTLDDAEAAQGRCDPARRPA